MSQAMTLAERSVLAPLKPGVGTALAFMGGLAVIGGLSGLALTAKKAPVWNYAGVGAGILVGGGIGYLGGRLIVARTIAKIEAAQAEEGEA